MKISTVFIMLLLVLLSGCKTTEHCVGGIMFEEKLNAYQSMYLWPMLEDNKPIDCIEYYEVM